MRGIQWPTRPSEGEIMAAIKAVYMQTDLEGVAGIDDWDPRFKDYANLAEGVRERLEMQRLMTGEVNAAAEGLFEAGVENILINDSHGPGRTLLVEELIPGVRIGRGKPKPAFLLGLSSRFDALVQVGMHPMAGTPSGCLAHTMSRGLVFRANGREIGEMEITAYIAGAVGIPWIFTSGDLHACREAERWVPGIATAPVKEGLAEACAIHLAPEDARKLIRERIQEAVARAAQIPLLPQERPVVLEVVRDTPWPAELNPGAERVDAFTIRYRGASFYQVFHHYRFGEPDYPLPG